MGIIFHSPTSNKIRLVSWVDQESRALPTQERDTTDDEDELVMCRSAGVASRIIIRICSGRTRRLARHGRFLPRSGTRNQDTGHNRVVLGRRTRSIGLRAGTTVQSRCAIHDLGSGCIGFCSRQAQAIKCKLRRNREAAPVGGLFVSRFETVCGTGHRSKRQQNVERRTVACRLLARSGGPRMSALAPLLGAKRKSPSL